MATPFRVDFSTPERSLFGGEADEVSMRTEVGEITFLAHHEDFVGASDATVVRIHAVGSTEGEGSELRVAMHGGVVHVDHDGLVILAGVAELADEIDVERARRALASAEAQLAESADARPASAEGEADDQRAAADTAESARKRARARLDAAGVDTAA